MPCGFLWIPLSCIACESLLCSVLLSSVFFRLRFLFSSFFNRKIYCSIAHLGLIYCRNRLAPFYRLKISIVPRFSVLSTRSDDLFLWVSFRCLRLQKRILGASILVFISIKVHDEHRSSWEFYNLALD